MAIIGDTLENLRVFGFIYFPPVCLYYVVTFFTPWEGEMFCVGCGTEINDSVKFCPSCGAAQQTDGISVAEAKTSTAIPEYPKASSELGDKYQELSTDELLKLSEQQEPIAWVILGNRYQDGEGVKQNNDEAFKWYKKSADAGEPWGINNLGVAYKNAWGVEKDLERATKLYHQSAKLGWLPAMGSYAYNLRWGLGIEKNIEDAVRWYRLGAERGDSYCQYNLAMYFRDAIGVEADDNKAVYWYQKAAEQNYSDALLSLGWMYDMGRGVEKDPSKGHDLYIQSAELGNSTAMNNVGLNYENGRSGVEKDLVKANEWYLKAAEAGNERAMFNLGSSYEYGTGFTKNWEEAKKWYLKAAEKGNKEADFRAQFRMFNMYDCGDYEKKVRHIKFYRTYGTVLEHKRSSETHVSSSGGGGYVGKYGGHVEAAQIHSKVITTDDIWIETGNGNEEKISLTNYDVALRSGQKISIFHAILEGEKNGPYMCLVNHSDGQTHWLKSRKGFMADKRESIYNLLGCLGCLSFLLVLPIIMALRNGYNINKDIDNIVKGMDSHLLKIEAWAKNNAD